MLKTGRSFLDLDHALGRLTLAGPAFSILAIMVW